MASIGRRASRQTNRRLLAGSRLFPPLEEVLYSASAPTAGHPRFVWLEGDYINSRAQVEWNTERW